MLQEGCCEREYAIVKISIHFGNSAAFFGVFCFCFRHMLRICLFFLLDFPFISTFKVDISEIMSDSDDKYEHKDRNDDGIGTCIKREP